MNRQEFSLLLFSFLSIILLSCAIPVVAIDVDVGDIGRLKVTNPKGVPLHLGPESSTCVAGPLMAPFGEVLEFDQASHWVKLRLEDERIGWVVENYIDDIIHHRRYQHYGEWKSRICGTRDTEFCDQNGI